MSHIYPTLEDMVVDNCMTAEKRMQDEANATQHAITGTSAGDSADTAGALYPVLNEPWMGIDSRELELYKPGVIAPVTGKPVEHAEIKQGVRQVIGCKDPATKKIGISVESINKGVFVAFVEEGSVASKAGLRFGDQLLQINDETVAGWSKSKTMDYLKKADPQQIKFAVRDRPFERTITCVKDSSGHIGFQFKNGKTNAIVKDSSAARNGMLTDHYLVEINGRNVVGMSDSKILKVIQETDRSVTVTVMPKFVYDHMIKHLGSSLKKHMDHSAPSDM